MDKNKRQEVEELNKTLAKRGERVLAMAHLSLPKSNFPEDFKFDDDVDGKANFP